MYLPRQKLIHDLKMTIPIVSVLLINKGKILIFKRKSGQSSFITGKVKPGESFIQAANREVFEETGINSFEMDINQVGYSFLAISPGGAKIYGNAFFAILPNTYCLKEMRLNHEMEEFWLLKPREALKTINKNGYPEALGELQELLSSKIHS